MYFFVTFMFSYNIFGKGVFLWFKENKLKKRVNYIRLDIFYSLFSAYFQVWMERVIQNVIFSAIFLSREKGLLTL